MMTKEMTKVGGKEFLNQSWNITSPEVIASGLLKEFRIEFDII